MRWPTARPAAGPAGRRGPAGGRFSGSTTFATTCPAADRLADAARQAVDHAGRGRRDRSARRRAARDRPRRARRARVASRRPRARPGARGRRASGPRPAGGPARPPRRSAREMAPLARRRASASTTSRWCFSARSSIGEVRRRRSRARPAAAAPRSGRRAPSARARRSRAARASRRRRPARPPAPGCSATVAASAARSSPPGGGSSVPVALDRDDQIAAADLRDLHRHSLRPGQGRQENRHQDQAGHARRPAPSAHPGNSKGPAPPARSIRARRPGLRAVPGRGAWAVRGAPGSRRRSLGATATKEAFCR